MSNKLSNFSALGKEISEALDKQRLTKKWLYSKMGLSRGTLDNWISGATAPDHQELQKIYELLGLNAQKNKHIRAMHDIIEDDNYIGMHKRVYDSLEASLATFQELARQAQKNVSDLTQVLAGRSGRGNGPPQVS